MIKIFVLASGRSGTKYLSGLFKRNVKNCIAKHEPLPGMFGKPIYWCHQGDMEKVKNRFMKKKRRISQSHAGVYIETNHAFLKSFADVAMECFPDMKLIHVIRNPLKVARSELNRQMWLDKIHLPFRYYIGDNGERYFRWSLTGLEDIYHQVAIDLLSLYQKYAVQWIEIENRAMMFLEKYHKYSDCYTLSVPEDLNNEQVVKELFDLFSLQIGEGHLRMYGRRNLNPVPTVVNEEDKKQFQEVVNNLPDKYLKIFQKRPYTRFEWVKLLTKSGTSS
ncbi:MAG: hypothetical protein JSW60_03450 [Thermoplasmatales archaeon]|nr:MAG: hypothetical protein JSW60_03450 [Thermoplasmatales archaeon]